MFNKKKQPPIKSLIAEGTQIEGNMAFTDGLASRWRRCWKCHCR